MMRPADRNRALVIAAQLKRRNIGIMRDAADTITFLVAHIDALTPMARAWANGDNTFTAGVAAVSVMDPAEDC